MTLTLKIPKTVESALEAKAARLGVPVERYAAGVLRRDVENNAAHGETQAHEARVSRRLAALREVVETARSFGSTPGALTAPLSDWALSRAGAYEEEPTA